MCAAALTGAGGEGEEDCPCGKEHSAAVRLGWGRMSLRRYVEHIRDMEGRTLHPPYHVDEKDHSHDNTLFPPAPSTTPRLSTSATWRAAFSYALRTLVQLFAC